MSGNDNRYSLDLEKHIMEKLSQQVQQPQENLPPEIWTPEEYEYRTIREAEKRKFKESIMQDWNELRKKDPNEEFRRQTVKDIAEIKSAIRKIGILLSEDAPSKEMQNKHKMLKDAYKKYKMIEALVLGEETK